MRFVSTKGGKAHRSISAAIRSGTAPDGGLYIPLSLEWLDASDLGEGDSLAAFAKSFLQPFFVGDELEYALPEICEEAFDFPAPLVQPDPAQPNLKVLELFHGPTAAFKDFGARFLMACLNRLADADHTMTVLVATSGDTGGAVGCAGEGRKGIRTVILFPKGRVSPFQERQLTCWKGGVSALEVDGDFDDCQRLAKETFADRDFVREHRLTSANSINVGRLLPQAAYLARAAVQVFGQTGRKPGFIIPTGNLGHGFAALLARAMRAPIGPIILATNANRALKDWAETGRFRPRPSIATLANAMDVGNPSNFERLQALQNQLGETSVETVSDEQIRIRIRNDHEQFGYVWCPHSATAAEVYARLSPEQTAATWVIAATAHPYKFREIVEPIVRSQIEASPQMASIGNRGTSKTGLQPSLEALAEYLGLI